MRAYYFTEMPYPYYPPEIAQQLHSQRVILPNLEAAKGEAEKDIVDIKENRFAFSNGDWNRWSIEICDHDGDLLLVVPFTSN